MTGYLAPFMSMVVEGVYTVGLPSVCSMKGRGYGF